MKFITSLALFGLAGVISAQAALLVYEPFEYGPDLSDSVLGALNGKDGGTGFAGTWEDMTSGSNNGEGFIYDDTGNTNGTNGAKPDWDGVVDNLPTVGGYVGLSPYSNDQQEDRLNARRTLGQSAGAMAGADGILWVSMIVHFEDNRFFFAPALALTDGGGFQERVTNLSDASNGLGIGNGGPPINDGRNETDVTASHYIVGTRDETTKTDITNLSTATADYVLVLKYAFGDDSDSVSAWAFAESDDLSEANFDANASTLTSSANIDEDSLTTLAVGITRAGNAYDEIRIGDSFGDVVSGGGSSAAAFAVTEIVYSPADELVTLSWNSQSNAAYTLLYARDPRNLGAGEGGDGDIGDDYTDNDEGGVDLDPEEGKIKIQFTNPDTEASDLFFSVHKN
jgi:hypothetical protein